MEDSARSGVIKSFDPPGPRSKVKSGRVPRKRGGTAKEQRVLAARTKSAEHLLEEHASESEVRRIRLTLFQPDAQAVFVAGTFSNWQASAIPLARQPDGTWLAELLLNPGSYEYRFIVDGRWMDDPMASRYVPNPFGETNCVLEVKGVA